MKKLSSKRAKQIREYIKLRKQYLEDHPHCQARIHGCTVRATEVHHAKGRIGNLLTDIKHFVAICRNCHRWVEEHPAKAREIGLSKCRLVK